MSFQEIKIPQCLEKTKIKDGVAAQELQEGDVSFDELIGMMDQTYKDLIREKDANSFLAKLLHVQNLMTFSGRCYAINKEEELREFFIANDFSLYPMDSYTTAYYLFQHESCHRNKAEGLGIPAGIRLMVTLDDLPLCSTQLDIEKLKLLVADNAGVLMQYMGSILLAPSEYEFGEEIETNLARALLAI